VKPLEREQLNNWHAYLDFEIKQKKKPRVECLFGRCVIACALYEDFWLKVTSGGRMTYYASWFDTPIFQYGSYLESVKDEEGAKKVYKQAADIHCSRKPGIHLAYSAFEESCGNNSKPVVTIRRLTFPHCDNCDESIRPASRAPVSDDLRICDLARLKPEIKNHCALPNELDTPHHPSFLPTNQISSTMQTVCEIIHPF